jgi:Acetyltransferases
VCRSTSRCSERAFLKQISIRRGGAGDTPALARLAALTFPLACPPHTTAEAIATFIATNLSEERFDAYLADAARDLFLAEGSDGAALGYTMLVAGEPADADVAAALTLRPTVELSKCYVHPDAHGGGVAAALMAASVDAARTRGAAGLWLGVNQQNAKAQRFYAKSGFARVGVKRFLVGDRFEDDFVLERAL